MSFKNAASRGAFFEKMKQKGGIGTPSTAGISAPKIPKMTDVTKLPSIAPVRPMGSFEKLKRSIKMPKVN